MKLKTIFKNRKVAEKSGISDDASVAAPVGSAAPDVSADPYVSTENIAENNTIKQQQITPQSTMTDEFEFGDPHADSYSSIEEEPEVAKDLVKQNLSIDTGLALKWKPEGSNGDNVFTPDSFETQKIISIAMKKIASPAEDNFPTSISGANPSGAVPSAANPNRNSHRFSYINPNYKIKRLPVQTIELLNTTFSEYVGGEEALQYKSLDPNSEAAYLMERKGN